MIDLGDVPLVGNALGQVLKAYPRLETPRVIHETVRRVISEMVSDVLAQTSRNVAEHHPKSSENVRILTGPLVSFSAQMIENNRILQQFLSGHMYKHPRVLEIMARAQRIIGDLFNAYMNDETLLPQEWREDHPHSDTRHYARQVCDFLAGHD